MAVLLTEILLTAFFLFVILGVTTAHAPSGFAPLAIGLTLTLIHLISIPIDNTSVNPARSLGVAFFNGNGAPARSGCSSSRRSSGRSSPVDVRARSPSSTSATRSAAGHPVDVVTSRPVIPPSHPRGWLVSETT